MKKTIASFIILSAFLVYLFLMGFSLQGDKVPGTSPSGDGQEVVFGPEVENPVIGLYESFENTTFPPNGWKKFNPLGGTGWTRQTVGTSPMPGWNGGVITAPPGGQSAIAYCTWNTSGSTSTDQWLVTPKLDNISDQDSLVFRIKYPGFSHNYQDFVDIMISTTGASIGSFYTAHTMFWAGGTNDTNWVRRAFKLTSFPGVTAGSHVYIAFRERVSNNYNEGGAIFLDVTEITTLTNIQLTGSGIPDKFALKQNYPNPFNPSTKIRFDIPARENTKLDIFNSAGQQVSSLINKELQPGSYEYTFDGSQLTSGVYFYRLQTGNFVETKRMILVK